MSNRSKGIGSGLLGIILLIGLAVGLIFLLNRTAPIETAQKPEPKPGPILVDTPTPVLQGNPFDSPVETPTPWMEPTAPPVLTPLPTPIVTPIPLAEPPYLTPLPSEEVAPYTILIFTNDHMVKAVDSDSLTIETFVDINAQTNLFLGNRTVYVRPWGRGGFAPNGKQVALVLSSVENGNMQPRGAIITTSIHLLDMETREIRLLVEKGKEPVWSPDGRYIAYRDHTDLWIINVETGERKALFTVDQPNSEWVNFFTWSPDSQKIAFVKTESILEVGEIWIVDIAHETESVLLLPLEPGKRSTSGGAGLLSWSPDGDLILFTSSWGEKLTPGSTTNLWVIDVRTGTQAQLTQNMTVYGEGLTWLLDGEQILFAASDKLEAERPNVDFWLIAKDGTNLKRLTQDSESDLYLQQIANRNQIIFQKGDSGLWELDLETGISRQVYPEPAIYMVVP